MQKSIKKALEDETETIPSGRSDIKNIKQITITKPTSSVTARKLRRQSTDQEQSLEFPLTSFEMIKDLDGLWDLHNNVEFDCMGLRQQRKELIAENKHLRGMMRAVLEAAALDKSGMVTMISTRVCSRYKGSMSAPPKSLNA